MELYIVKLVIIYLFMLKNAERRQYLHSGVVGDVSVSGEENKWEVDEGQLYRSWLLFAWFSKSMGSFHH